MASSGCCNSQRPCSCSGGSIALNPIVMPKHTKTALHSESIDECCNNNKWRACI
jgi:hypothetical protein